jgi:hypothetical protein
MFGWTCQAQANLTLLTIIFICLNWTHKLFVWKVHARLFIKQSRQRVKRALRFTASRFNYLVNGRVKAKPKKSRRLNQSRLARRPSSLRRHGGRSSQQPYRSVGRADRQPRCHHEPRRHGAAGRHSYCRVRSYPRSRQAERRSRLGPETFTTSVEGWHPATPPSRGRIPDDVLGR